MKEKLNYYSKKAKERGSTSQSWHNIKTTNEENFILLHVYYYKVIVWFSPYSLE